MNFGAKRANPATLIPHVYQLLLTKRYLTSKIMPLLAALAVALCTAMVIVVWSVMGGFLVMLINSGRTLAGDVSISWPITGFAYYEDLIKRLEADPEVAAAAPMIETYGLIGLPDGRTETVQIKGIDGPSFSKVTSYDEILYWRPIDKPNEKDTTRQDLRLGKHDLWKQLFDGGKRLVRTEVSKVDGKAVERPAVVPGISVSGFNFREPWGFYPGLPYIRTTEGDKKPVDMFMLPVDGTVTLNVLPMDSKGRAIEMVARTFPVANEFHSGLYEIDHKTVFVQLKALQDMLKMNRAAKIDTSGGGVKLSKNPNEEAFLPPTIVSEDPARVTNVLVRSKRDSFDMADAERLAERVSKIYGEFAAAHAGKVPESTSIRILTWVDQNRTMITAVKKETALVLFIFCFVSLTAVFLVLAIFWAMVSEKTRDIGVLRAVGASRSGVAGLWLLYGLAIGIVGAAFGFALAYVVVTNINEIHEWMGRLGERLSALTGTQINLFIWDPRVYYFTKIPSDLDPTHVIIVLCGGLLASCLGALWPAARAARMNPVQALRFE
ncbi:MAG: ABC transporter permease [Phycisphaeraceae bacterium]|nr:ABC transporter permease [Phycisphaeraceae bacterium]